nr:MAG TPA: hypothetical protein [Caudoviricetes sp.]
MRWKDLAVGKYVTLNRYLNGFCRLYSEVLEIVYVPDTKEDGKVGCRQVTRCGSIRSKDKYVDDTITYISYIHLLEVKDNPYDCRNWAIGDTLVPTEHLVRFAGKPLISHAPYTIWNIGGLNGLIRFYIRSHDGVINRDYTASPLYFKKDNSVSVWKGLFASQYYKKEIKFDDNGELVKPVTVAKGSPAYNQILKEAKACGVIKG